MRNTFNLMMRTILFLGLGVVGASGATLIVTKTADTSDGICNADCSLREAIAASASGDTVTFDAGLFFAPRRIRLSPSFGQLAITDRNLTVTGVGGVTIEGGDSRVFFVNAAGFTVNLSGMILTNGSTSGGGGIQIFNGTVNLTEMNIIGNNGGSGGGGGIFVVGGTLNLSNSNVSDNTASGNGGGINSNSGTNITITNSTISGNTAGNSGGGILHNGASLTISNSAILGNAASSGGGINGGNAVITNSTISGNRATGTNEIGGGIIGNSGTWTNLTITGNSANGNGGGIIVNAATIRNSLIAGNSAPTNPDVAGNIVSQGNNLVQNRGTSFGYIATDLPNGTNPLLGSLSNNGGLSAIHALQTGSPAIDAGNDAFATGATDQRGAGFARTVGAAIDIGAFETQGPTATSTSISGRIKTADERGIKNVRLLLANGATGETLRAISNPFGYYRFENILAGQTYLLTVSSKRFLFDPNTRVITLLNELTNEDFTALSIENKGP